MHLGSRTQLAWLVFLATFACLIGGLLVTLSVTRPLTVDALVNGALEGAIWLLFASIGLVLTLRRPANPIGWLYAAAGLVWSLYIPWDPWVDELLRGGRPLPPAARLAALAGDSLWAVGITLAITLPLLLLPNGRLRSSRWRLVAAAAIAGTAATVVGWSLAPDPMTQTLVPVAKPFPLHGVAGQVADAIAPLLLPLGFTGLLPDDLFSIPLLLSVPLAIAVAVLRYRLWDLDRLISRTVTYAAITALLVVPYLLILPVATGLAQGSGSLAVAALTLAAAALFQPLRRRVQELVDRRFNRRRHDAARTVDAFAVRLRDQVDLTALHAELLAVVDQTMQPTQASLWLRPPAAGGPLRMAERSGGWRPGR
jgi:hypothetical protein